MCQEDDMRDARETIRSAVQDLKNSCLLLDGKTEGSVRLHDVIRDVAIRISKDGPRFFVKAGRGLKTWPRLDDDGCYTAISLMKNKICVLPDQLVCSKLHILLLQSNSYSKIPESFLITLQAVRVLDLSLTGISMLPSSFIILNSLHTLCLNGCVSMTSGISQLGSLKKLKILSMRKIRLAKLPEEIGQLTSLRMLDFTSESVDIVPSNVICKLSELEELYMQCNYTDWGSTGEGGAVEGNIVEESRGEGSREKTNASFDELFGLSELQNLKVFISDPKCLPEHVKDELKWRNFDICIGRDLSFRDLPLDSSPSPDSKALTLDTTMGTLPKWFIRVVTMNTEKLKYRNSEHLSDVLEECYQGKLHKLKYLHVSGPSDKLEQLMTNIKDKPVFKNLEELHLENLNSLKRLCVGELPDKSLSKLRLLKVRGCHVLMSALLSSNLLKRLQKLEKLICEDMDELEYVFSSDRSVVEQSTLTELIEMSLKNLVKLRKICNGPAPLKFFSHVKSLVVFKCNGLEGLFTSSIAHHLDNLEVLKIENCGKLQRVIEASEEPVKNKITFPKLKELALKKLFQLTRFYGSARSAIDDEEKIEFPLLEDSMVERCHCFKSPAKDMLVSVKKKKKLVLIPVQETG